MSKRVEQTVLIVLPPTPIYDPLRDLLVAGFALGGTLIGYDEESDALLVRVLGGRRRKVKQVYEPSFHGEEVVYGNGKIRIHPGLRIDPVFTQSLGFVKPVVSVKSFDMLVAVDWRVVRYHSVEIVADELKNFIDVVSNIAFELNNLEYRILKHALVLYTAAKLNGLRNDIRLILLRKDGLLDASLIPASMYRILRSVDDVCLKTLESIALEAFKGSISPVEYLANIVESRDVEALKTALRRMGCRLATDELIAPAEVLG